MIGTHIVTVPVKFAVPPTDRDAVYEAVGSLSGWNGLDRTVGTPDETLFDLRLDVNAKSVKDAVWQGEQMYPMFFGRLTRYGPALAGPIIAVSREEYLRATEEGCARPETLASEILACKPLEFRLITDIAGLSQQHPCEVLGDRHVSTFLVSPYSLET